VALDRQLGVGARRGGVHVLVHPSVQGRANSA
jgi:hypothetical protein